MPVRIVKTFDETKSYLNQVRECADSNKLSFGFLPSGAYEELALNGKLWVAISSNSYELQGYLLFGGTYPTLRVSQLYVEEKFRNKGIASILLEELINYGEQNNYSTIRAKVATELEANQFWEDKKFLITKQELGGSPKSANRRLINFRSYSLNTPDLFKEPIQEDNVSLSYPEKPQFSLPVFILDLNILYDITRNRENSNKARQIFERGLSGSFRLCITPEFKKELERTQTNKNNDPIYEIAKAFPTLSSREEFEIIPLCEELRKIIFPDRSIDNRNAVNDQSDLIHLAYCSLNKVGFITSEKAILRQSTILKKTYGITVVSPSEIDFATSSDESLSIESSEELLTFKKLVSSYTKDLELFLINIGLNQILINSLKTRKHGNANIKEVIVSDSTGIIGFCSWNLPNSLSLEIDCYLYVDETNIHAITVIDHFIERTIRDSCPQKITRIDLHFEQKQSLTKSTAKKKGYFSTNKEDLLTKVTFNGFISKKNWQEFSNEFSKLTNRKYPTNLPAPKDLINTGIRVQEKLAVHSRCINLFKFESIISPGVILHEDRNCLILPIKEPYANDLLGNMTLQRSLLPSKNTSLLLEKAYFRKPSKASYFKKGNLIAFYVSGNNSSQEIVGIARITYTDILTLDQVNLKIHRQGVLSKEELNTMLNKNGKLHVLTFDNFKEFPQKISFKKARELKLISAANLVTVEKIPFTKLKILLETAYNL